MLLHVRAPLSDQARAGLFPTLGLNAGVQRNRQSFNAPLRGPTTPTYYNNNTVGGSVSYELDLWDEIRNEVAAGKTNAAASAADLENARLSLLAQLADDYIQLRSLDRTGLYRQGATDYLTVVTSQTALLQTQLQELNLNTLQLTASVDLIRALGGGWKSE